MVDVADQALLVITQQEDYVAQFWWTGDDGDPIPLQQPITLQVKDGNGQTILDFDDDQAADVLAVPKVTYLTDTGFFQLTVPSAVTRDLIPGRYGFDMFVTVLDPGSPFYPNPQTVPVFSGYVQVNKASSSTPPPPPPPGP